MAIKKIKKTNYLANKVIALYKSCRTINVNFILFFIKHKITKKKEPAITQALPLNQTLALFTDNYLLGMLYILTINMNKIHSCI